MEECPFGVVGFVFLYFLVLPKYASLCVKTELIFFLQKSEPRLGMVMVNSRSDFHEFKASLVYLHSKFQAGESYTVRHSIEIIKSNQDQNGQR